MAVNWNQNLGLWQVNGRGAYGTRQEAEAADQSTAAPAPTRTDAATFGANAQAAPVAPGVTAGSTYNPNTPAAQLDRDRVLARQTANVNVQSTRQGPGYDPTAATLAHLEGNIGGVGGAHIMGDRTGAAQNQWKSEVNEATVPGGFDARMEQNRRQMPGAPPYGEAQREAGYHVPGASTNQPSNAMGATPPPFSSVDYSRYDEAAQRIRVAEDTLMSELDRLSGVDPFGNQAFLRQATDRAAAQSAGIAAGGLSTATARAGNIRQAQGQQAAMVAQGRDAAMRQRSADQVQAGGLRVQAAGQMGQLATAGADNEVQLAALQAQTISQNLNSWIQHQGITLPLEQQDVENLRRIALEYAQLDMERYKTDVEYRAHADEMILGKYQADKNFEAIKMQVDAQENVSFGEFAMGLLGAGAGLAGGIATAPAGSVAGKLLTSDRRAKIDIHDPDLRDLQDYLGGPKGKLYRYREPNKPGRRPGLNFGPMAQDLARSRIGRTVVSVDPEGTLQVDTGRLALADHAALKAVAQDLAELKKAVGK